MALIISADEIKKTLPDYTPDKSELFHHQSAALADKQFEEAVKTNSFQNVILLCGGTASGKTEFLATHLNKKRCIILDATLSTELGAEIKIKKILAAKKKPIIYAIIPDDLVRAFIAFLNRDRKFSDSHFYKTHSGSRKTLLSLLEKFPQVRMHIIESSYTSDQNLQFTRLEFENKKQLNDYLLGIQLTETDIIKKVFQLL